MNAKSTPPTAEAWPPSALVTIEDAPKRFQLLRDAANWSIKHSKNISYLLMGSACVWTVPYCVMKKADVPGGVLTVIGLVFGIGGATAGWKAHVSARGQTGEGA